MASAKQRLVAVACQGGGSHTAYTAGVLDVLLDRQNDNEYRIMGLSGTSGGALCALVAWYGLLKGGTSLARSGLRELWADNAATGLWEQTWNACAVSASDLPVDVHMTPYQPPLSWILAWGRYWAPRPQWVDLRLLVEKHVRFADIGHLGALEQLQDEVGQWLCADDASDLHIASLGPGRPDLDRAQLAEVVANVRALDRDGRGPSGRFLKVQELAADLRRIEEIAGAGGRWTRPDVERLRDALRSARAKIPVLLIGAADVATGEFKAFSSRKNEITADAVCASAAIPWVFKAVEHKYWDGLFSQNPPIRQFVSDPDSAAHKPDELWIVQINPQSDPKAPPTSASAILERRNQMSGNLSLNQEIAAIKATNRWLGEHLLAGSPRYKLETIHWIRMHVPTLEARWPMGPASKMDRDPGFLEALREHGETQAQLFLPIRRFIEDVWKEANGRARKAAAEALCAGGSGVSELLNTVDLMQDNLQELYVTIDGMDIMPTRVTARQEIAGRASLDWSGHGMHSGKQVLFQGKADLVVANGRIAGGAIHDMSIIKIRTGRHEPQPKAADHDPRRGSPASVD